MQEREGTVGPVLAAMHDLAVDLQPVPLARGIVGVPGVARGRPEVGIAFLIG